MQFGLTAFYNVTSWHVTSFLWSILTARDRYRDQEQVHRSVQREHLHTILYSIFLSVLHLICVLMGYLLIRACRIYEVEIEGEEQLENSTTANSRESERDVTETQTKLVAEKAEMEEEHKEVKENKVLSEKDSCPSSETKCNV